MVIVCRSTERARLLVRSQYYLSRVFLIVIHELIKNSYEMYIGRRVGTNISRKDLEGVGGLVPKLVQQLGRLFLTALCHD